MWVTLHFSLWAGCLFIYSSNCFILRIHILGWVEHVFTCQVEPVTLGEARICTWRLGGRLLGQNLWCVLIIWWSGGTLSAMYIWSESHTATLKNCGSHFSLISVQSIDSLKECPVTCPIHWWLKELVESVFRKDV